MRSFVQVEVMIGKDGAPPATVVGWMRRRAVEQFGKVVLYSAPSVNAESVKVQVRGIRALGARR